MCHMGHLAGVQVDSMDGGQVVIQSDATQEKDARIEADLEKKIKKSKVSASKTQTSNHIYHFQ